MPKSVILLFLLCFTKIVAQSSVRITGKIQSSENENVTHATISFDINNQHYTTVSDTLGIFSKNIPLGFLTIKVEHLNFAPKTFSFQAVKDTAITIVLEKDISQLKEVVVSNDKKTGIKNLSGGKMSLNLKDLSSVPTILGTTDIIKILQLTPGVQNSGDANGYLYVRGGDPGHNAILYDGTPIYGMAHLLGIFPFYNTDHIKDVEFDKSSTNSKYGGRLSSTVLLNTNKEIPSAFSIQGNLGILASQVTLGVPFNDKNGIYISGRKTYIDAIVGNVNGDIQDSQYGFSDANVTFLSQISKNNLFSINAFVSGDDFEVNEEDFGMETDLKWSNFTLSSSLSTAISSKINMSNAVYYSQYSNDLNMNQATIQLGVSSSVKDFGFTNTIQYSIKNVPFESGLQYAHHSLQPQKINIDNLTTNNNNSFLYEMKPT